MRVFSETHGHGHSQSSIFGTYDIRGLYPAEINLDVSKRIGRALGVTFGGPFLIGRDTRRESSTVQRGLEIGLRSVGALCTNIGIVPTPVIVFAARIRKEWGIIVTPSHNPGAYAGVKCVGPSGQLFSTEWARVRKSYEADPLGPSPRQRFRVLRPESRCEGVRIEIRRRYLEQVSRGANMPLKVVLDCRGGSTSILAPQAFRRLRAHVIELSPGYSNVFHGQSAEPTSKNVTNLRRKVVSERASFGVSFDGDGDRVLFVDEIGYAVPPEAIALLLYEHNSDLSSPLVTTYDASAKLNDLVRLARTRTGSRFITAAMRKLGGEVGFEPSSHYYLKHEGTGSDGLLVACRVGQAVAQTGVRLSAVRRQLGPCLRRSRTLRFLNRQATAVAFKNLTFEVLRRGGRRLGDGILLHGSWGSCFIRRSNTEPVLRFSIEPNSKGGVDLALGVVSMLVKLAEHSAS
jgi:phosphoglucosamine mutase